jgi:hypothetical protein
MPRIAALLGAGWVSLGKVPKERFCGTLDIEQRNIPLSEAHVNKTTHLAGVP